MNSGGQKGIKSSPNRSTLSSISFSIRFRKNCITRPILSIAAERYDAAKTIIRKWVALCGLLHRFYKRVIRQREDVPLQTVTRKAIKNMVDRFWMCFALVQYSFGWTLLFNRAVLRNKMLDSFTKPGVQQGVDVLIMIIEYIGADIRPFGQCCHGDHVKWQFF